MAEVPLIFDRATNSVKADTDITEIDDSDSPYTVDENNDLILVDCSLGAVTVTLYAPSSSNKKFKVTIKDVTGNASSNNITIEPDGSNTIEGVAYITLTVDYDCIVLVSDGVSNHVVLSI